MAVGQEETGRIEADRHLHQYVTLVSRFATRGRPRPALEQHPQHRGRQARHVIAAFLRFLLALLVLDLVFDDGDQGHGIEHAHLRRRLALDPFEDLEAGRGNTVEPDDDMQCSVVIALERLEFACRAPLRQPPVQQVDGAAFEVIGRRKGEQHQPLVTVAEGHPAIFREAVRLELGEPALLGDGVDGVDLAPQPLGEGHVGAVGLEHDAAEVVQDRLQGVTKRSAAATEDKAFHQHLTDDDLVTDRRLGQQFLVELHQACHLLRQRVGVALRPLGQGAADVIDLWPQGVEQQLA